MGDPWAELYYEIMCFVFVVKTFFVTVSLSVVRAINRGLDWVLDRMEAT